MRETGVYRTESGTIFRVSKSDEGQLSVQILKQSVWESGPVGIAGLRIAPTTKRLTKHQVAALPD
jgi:hypothetical protein